MNKPDTVADNIYLNFFFKKRPWRFDFKRSEQVYIYSCIQADSRE